MNVDDENIEPVTDLEPAPSYLNHNQYIQRLLNSGAGANAGSTFDMTYVAADPLSELVWSPQKGLSLKCADGSFSEKKSSFLCGTGSSNVNSRMRNNKPVIAERNMAPMAPFSGNREDSSEEKMSKFFQSGEGHSITAASNSKMEDKKAADGLTLLQENKYLIINEKEMTHKTVNLTKSETPETCFPDERKLEVAQDNPSSTPTCGKSDMNLSIGMKDLFVSKDNTVKEGSSHNTKGQNAASSKGEHNESPSSAEKGSEKIMDSCPSGTYPMEKPESTAENDVKTFVTENVNDLTAKATGSVSGHEFENSLQDDGRLPNDNAFASKLSPSSSGILRYKIKGKGKALSDGDVSGKMQNDDDDSHGSAESCNSAGLFLTGKRRCNADQQFVVESKKVKRHLQDDSPVSLFAQKDSSFMNWISNMTKGLLRSNEDETPSPPLTLANPSHGPGQDSHNQAIVMSNRNQEYGCGTTGFQSIFQSLYCSRNNAQVNISLNSNYRIEEAKEPEVGNKICDLNATPIACRARTGNLYKRFLPTEEKLNEPISSSGETLVANPKCTSAKGAASKEFKMIVSPEEKAPPLSKTDMEKDEASLSSSACKHKASDDANMISGLPSAGKTDDISGFLKSSWITRLTSKASGQLQISGSKSPGETADFTSPDGMRLNSSLQCHLDSDDHKGPETGDFPDREPIQKCAPDIDSSFGFYTSKVQFEEKPICKLKLEFPSPKLKKSEAMASIFAKRLDALKHIMPSNVTDTCFFSGAKGHHLQDCASMKDSELDNVLSNLNSYNKAKDQLNTNSPPRQQAPCSTSLVNESYRNRIQLNSMNLVTRSSDGRDGQFPDTLRPALHDGNESRMDKDLNLKLKFSRTSSPERSRFGLKLFNNDFASANKENKLKVPQITPLTNFLTRQTSDVPKGIFDAMKQLRLPRTDILKWMNSKSPLSRLDGFFVRLRLGKWEEGLGGTGYYVACITGEKGGSPPLMSKNPIPVIVGGIKCLVESQYVSNHEFLEDEIMAWWSALLKGGGNIPSEEDLRLKVKEKMLLGY